MIYSTHLLRHLRFTIGQNLQRARVRRRWPLARLARASGVAQAKIDQYELGKSEIRLDELLKLACALGASVEKLLVGEGECARR